MFHWLTASASIQTRVRRWATTEGTTRHRTRNPSVRSKRSSWEMDVRCVWLYPGRGWGASIRCNKEGLPGILKQRGAALWLEKPPSASSLSGDLTPCESLPSFLVKLAYYLLLVF